MRPFRRLLPIGFHSGYKTHIAATIAKIDEQVGGACGFDADKPMLVDLKFALEWIGSLKTTLEFTRMTPFDWEAV